MTALYISVGGTIKAISEKAKISCLHYLFNIMQPMTD